jgi:hypothetical protein
MLIAKYAKVFPRTGTLPFMLAVSRGTLPLPPQVHRSNFLPTGTPTTYQWTYPTHKKYLSCPNLLQGNHALLDNVPRLSKKSLDMPSGPRQAFSTPAAEGQRNSKKICCWILWAPERGFRWARASQGNLTVARAKFAPRERSQCIDCIASEVAINNLASYQTGV